MIYDWAYSFECEDVATYLFQASRCTSIKLCAPAVIDVFLDECMECITMQSTVMRIGRLGE